MSLYVIQALVICISPHPLTIGGVYTVWSKQLHSQLHFALFGDAKDLEVLKCCSHFFLIKINMIDEIVSTRCISK